MTEADYEAVDRILASQNITYTGRNIRDELAAAGYMVVRSSWKTSDVKWVPSRELAGAHT
jgi:hypothetical protein